MKESKFKSDFYLKFWHKNRWFDDIILTNYVIIQTGKMQLVKYGGRQYDERQ